MKHRNISLNSLWRPTLALILFFTSSILVQASDSGYDEVSYDSLLNELHKKKDRYVSAPDPFENILIHSGVAAVNSISNVSVLGVNHVHYHNGIQLSVGIDLFSTHWYTEGAFRNFGTSQQGQETASLREFDLRVMYKGNFNEVFGYRFGGGIASRYYKISDPGASFNSDDTTPASVFVTGVAAHLSKNLDFGAELGGRSAMVSTTADKGAVDLSLRVDAQF